VEGIITSVFMDLPGNFSRRFNTPFNLPLCCEITCGPNLKDLT